MPRVSITIVIEIRGQHRVKHKNNTGKTQTGIRCGSVAATTSASLPSLKRQSKPLKIHKHYVQQAANFAKTGAIGYIQSSSLTEIVSSLSCEQNLNGALKKLF